MYVYIFGSCSFEHNYHLHVCIHVHVLMKICYKTCQEFHLFFPKTCTACTSRLMAIQLDSNLYFKNTFMIMSQIYIFPWNGRTCFENDTNLYRKHNLEQLIIFVVHLY